MMLSGLEPVAVGRPKPIVIIRPQGVGTAGKVLGPIVVLGLPGSLPVGIFYWGNAIEGIRVRHGILSSEGNSSGKDSV
jgi:hypothetical protein